LSLSPWICTRFLSLLATNCLFFRVIRSKLGLVPKYLPPSFQGPVHRLFAFVSPHILFTSSGHCSAQTHGGCWPHINPKEKVVLPLASYTSQIWTIYFILGLNGYTC
jgi:hypothetical protein